MPRISYIRTSDPVVNPAMALTDLAGGLLSGYVGEQMRRQNLSDQQAEAAFGNPYERRRRAITWNSLPPELRDSTDKQMYQDMIMRGSDPTSVLRAYKERATDPVYGDQPTQKARLADVDSAVKSGLITADDQAGRDAIRRGQITLGSLLSRKYANADREEARASEQANRNAARADEDAKNAERAAQLQAALNVYPRSTTPILPPTGIASQIPGAPVRFSHPSDVESAARIEAARANAGRDDDRASARLEIDRQKAEVARERLQATLSKRDLSPDQRAQLQTALQTLNNPDSTREDRAAAYTTAWQMGAVPLDAAVQRPAAEARANVDSAKQTLEYLRDLGRRLTGQNQAAEFELYSQQFGIPMVASPSRDGTNTLRPNKAAILADYTARLRHAEATAAAAPAELSPRTANDLNDQLKSLSDDDLDAIITGRK